MRFFRMYIVKQNMLFVYICSFCNFILSVASLVKFYYDDNDGSASGEKQLIK